jgi:hypothetical protein
VTSDTLVYTGAADVYWISAANAGAAGTWELNDSTNDSGTDKFAGSEPAGNATHMLPLPTPIHFETGIYVDMAAANGILTIGYAIL